MILNGMIMKKKKKKTTSSKKVLKQEKKGNDNVIMFGDKEIINKSAYDVNTNIIKNNPKISINESNNKQKYQQEMIYISPKKTNLVAIDKNTGKIYVVDFLSLEKQNKQFDKDSLSSTSSSTIPPPPLSSSSSIASTSTIPPPPLSSSDISMSSTSSSTIPPPPPLSSSDISNLSTTSDNE